MNSEELLGSLTMEEKYHMLAGVDLWHTCAVPRLGIPSMKLTDGPIGARGSGGKSGPTSACFPCGSALAATWNLELIRQVGEALAEETRAKGAQILLAPTVNIHRSPLAGRNFECFSEDPFLTGKMAIAYIQGLQSGGVGACIKHFVCNDSEFERKSMSSEVNVRALHEIYLEPFWMAIREARPWAVMSAYNKVNGTWCSENQYLLETILKEEWGFEGMVVSDWLGTYTENAVIGRLDLEMPGPARWMSEQVLEKQQNAGKITSARIDDKIARILRCVELSKISTDNSGRPERAIDNPAHHLLARRVAGEAVVLLRNQGGILPLVLKELKSIAVIGPNAHPAVIMGGGSTEVNPHYAISPLEGIRRVVRPGIDVRYAQGGNIYREIPALNQDFLVPDAQGRRGFLVEVFDDLELAEAPKQTWLYERSTMSWDKENLPGIDPNRFAVRLTADFQAGANGKYQFEVRASGQARMRIGDDWVVQRWNKTMQDVTESGERIGVVELAAGQKYHLLLEYRWEGVMPWHEMVIGCLPPQPDHSFEEAIALAKTSDVAVVVVGLTREWESEGFDRESMTLPGRQDELIEQVAAVNSNTIVVIIAGSPVEMPWLEQVSAVLQAWYLGQETGNALADVLFGAVNPSGKLPTTFPKCLKDNPAYINYPGENGRVHYGEGIFVGYRYYDIKDIEPLFPFGYGLSYTTFEYSDLQIGQAEYSNGQSIVISMYVRNSGRYQGAETVQLYLRDETSSLRRPEKELKAFSKVTLQPEEQCRLVFTLTEESLAFYDDLDCHWRVEPGTFRVLVGASSRDIRLEGTFLWVAGGVEGKPAQGSTGTAKLHIGLTIGSILENEKGKAILNQALPGLSDHPMLEMAKQFTLEQIAGFVPEVLTPEKIAEIAIELEKA